MYRQRQRQRQPIPDLYNSFTKADGENAVTTAEDLHLIQDPNFSLGTVRPVSQDNSGPKFRYYKPGIKTGLGFSSTAYPVPKLKRKKKAIENILSDDAKRAKILQNKPPVALLNELYPSLVYNFGEQEGPSHHPSFSVKVFVKVEESEEKEFIGQGKSKKDAKNNVAIQILEYSNIPISEWNTAENKKDNMMEQEIKEEDIDESEKYNPEDIISVPMKIDFSSDDVIMMDDQILRNMSIPPCPPPFLAEANQENFNFQSPEVKILNKIMNIQNLSENFLQALLMVIKTNPENKPEYTFVGEGEGLAHNKIFTVQLKYDDKEFVATGKSKKKARNEVAKVALESIFGKDKIRYLLENSSKLQPNIKKEKYTEDTEDNNMQDENTDAIKTPKKEYNKYFSEQIQNMVNNKLKELMNNDEKYETNKVVAGIILTTASPMLENCKVIAVTTGTKCIEGSFLSCGGLAINDCHAEILSTRCLRDFIFTQLEFLKLKKEISVEEEEIIGPIIFDKIENEGVCKFSLKPDVKFHLYISTSPCGDARIFSPNEVDDEVKDDHPNRSNRGQLRGKVEAGEGTIPVANLSTNGAPQCWDAILQGSALSTMSCSDKLTRWNICGMQGGLLSNFIDPIYYSSIIIGSLFHQHHMKRALIKRIKTLDPMEPFRVNKPELISTWKRQKRVVKKSPNFAIAWSSAWPSCETILANKGKCEDGVNSKLCKKEVFMRFLKLYKNESAETEDYLNLSYREAKSLATNYVKTKELFIEEMNKLNYGIWIKKPLEQDSFFLNN